MELYRNSIFQGGWFSFNSTKENWSKISKEMYDYFFGSVMFDEIFGASKTTEELFIKTDQNFDFVKDKSVLVIGGGPSSKNLTSEIIESYDLVFSCNHFFKNELLKKHKVSLALIGDEVDFSDKEFIEYLNEYNTILGFEHSSTRSTINLLSLKENYPLCFIYLSRYFSRLGYTPRVCILAKLFGAKKIDFIGIDGFKDNNSYHYFEKDKDPPFFNDNEKFKEQMRIFCEYMLKDLKIKPENFNDLSSNNLYEGILQDVKSKL